MRHVQAALSEVVVGQDVLIGRLITALFAAVPYSFGAGAERSGCAHVLLEGVPGVAKTLTVTTLARLVSAAFQRVQLTPDLMPADVLGTRVFDMQSGTFRVERGPVFTNILLADEVNRATPKTQSALLEAMQERQVTIGDDTVALADPFWVLGTQNPVEHEGVYPLPEAQLDRFSMMLRVGYPSKDDEVKMLQHSLGAHPAVAPLLDTRDVVSIRELIKAVVHTDAAVVDYIVRLGRATRDPGDAGLPHHRELIALGMSPRSMQHALALVRVVAFLDGRDYVLPADVKEVFPDVARHRLVRTIRAEAEGVEVDALVAELLDAVPLP